MKKITIAIDGFSSTGKSTIAKELASRLHYVYVDSGAMYRAVTLYAFQKEYISTSKIKKTLLINDLENIQLNFKYNEEKGYGEIHLNNVNVENEIRTLEISNLVSRIAEISEVREKLVEQQQEMGVLKGVVMDGRDIGTVVFPNAEVKLFMTASADTRAKRRFDELIEKGDRVTYDEIYKNVVERDFIDTTRDDSPLIKANDAIEIDNSDLTREEQIELIYKIVAKQLK